MSVGTDELLLLFVSAFVVRIEKSVIVTSKGSKKFTVD